MRNYLIKLVLSTFFIFSFDLEVSYSNTNFFVAGKSESCYPDFLGIGTPPSQPDKDTPESEILEDILNYERPCLLYQSKTFTEFLDDESCVRISPFSVIQKYIPNGTGSNCSNGKACYCELQSPNHFLPLSCAPSSDVEVFETCSFESSEVNLSHKNSGCSGGATCYRIPVSSNAFSNIQKMFKDDDSGASDVSIAQLTTLASSDGGICLPTHTCQPQQLGHNMIMKSQDECAFGPTAVEELDGENVCVNPAYKSEIIVPDSIEFHLDESNCSIFAVEMFDGEVSESPLFQNLFLPLPAGKLRISPALIKYANFERYLSSLQWLWGTADSKHVTNPHGQSNEKVKLGDNAKKALEKFDIHHRYIYALKAYELTKIKNKLLEELTGEESKEGADTDPLIGLRAKIEESEKLRDIIPLEVKNFRELLGGSNYISNLGAVGDTISEGTLFNDFKSKKKYKESLAYLRDGSNSISKSTWERVRENKKSCPSRWKYKPNRKIGCRKLNGDSLNCKPIPGYLETLFSNKWLGIGLHFVTFGVSTTISLVGDIIHGAYTKSDPQLINMKRCIDESIEVQGHITENNNTYNGKLINPIYPNSILSSSGDIEIKSTNIDSFGKRINVPSKTRFKEILKENYTNFINSPLPKFTSDEKNKVILFLDGASLLNGSLPTPNSMNQFISSEDLSGLERQKIGMTVLEYIYYQKSHEDPENIGIYVNESDVDNFKKDNEGHAELLKENTLSVMSDILYDHFIRMHFSRKQNQYHTSEVVAGAGFYNFETAIGDHGETLGYIKELYSMAEYIYKYQLGLEQGYNLQISCLQKELDGLDSAISTGNPMSESSNLEDSGGNDILFEFYDGLESMGLSEKEIKKAKEKLKKSLRPNIKDPTPNLIKSSLEDKTQSDASIKNKNKKSQHTSRLNEDKKLAKSLSKYRKNKIKRLNKINDSKKAQLISSDDIIKDILGPSVNLSNLSKIPKSTQINKSQTKSLNNKKKSKEKTENKPDPFAITKVSVSGDKDFEKTKYRLSKSRNRRSRRNKTSTGLSIKENRKILEGIKNNKLLFDNSNDDTLFERVTKTYIRAAYPRLLRLK